EDGRAKAHLRERENFTALVDHDVERLELTVLHDDGELDVLDARRFETLHRRVRLNFSLVRNLDVAEGVSAVSVDIVNHHRRIKVGDVRDLLEELLQDLVRPSVRVVRKSGLRGDLVELQLRGDEQIHVRTLTQVVRIIPDSAMEAEGDLVRIM